jgi:hypothetical protein
MTAIHRFPDGTWLDHVAWAVPDTAAGVEHLRALTGADVHVPDAPETGQWYLSAGLPLGDGRFLEVIGPAPGVRGHPFGEFLRALPEPRLLFWYVRATDWDEVERLARGAGRPLSRVEDVDDPDVHAYRRGGLGQELDPVVPNVIQWRRRRPGSLDDGTCRLASFTIGHPEHSSIAHLLTTLGVDMPVAPAPSPRLDLELATPNGVVRLEGVGNPLTGS